MLSRERIEAIRARAAAATPYPWEWEAADGSMLALGTKGAALMEGNVLMCARCEACQEHNKPCMWPKKPDADFIAHARQDVPDLLEHIDALETVLRRVRERNYELHDAPPWEICDADTPEGALAHLLTEDSTS